MVYDITNPAAATFQDYLNVRNWRNGETVSGDEVTLNLNDGPESLVFVSAAESPLGREMLLAATPLAGRLTVFLVERGEPVYGPNGERKTGLHSNANFAHMLAR